MEARANNDRHRQRQQKLKEQGKDKDYAINIMPHATKIMPILQDK